MTGQNHSKGLGGRVRAVLARFRRQRHGAVAPILALALIPILGAMGFGAEVSSWWLVQRSAQHAADSAVLAAAIDAGNNLTSANVYPSATPANNSCTTVPGPTTSWYCQAISTAASYSYARSATVHVEPAVVTCPNVAITSQCYKVTITKLVPIYLLGVLGFNGSDVVGGVKYQRITSAALAAAPGPPLDFCLLTTNGDIIGKGTPNANLNGCDTFSNGNTDCTGSNGLQAGAAYASGSNGGGCSPNGPNIGNQNYQCDPYGPTTQTFAYNDGSKGTFTESCTATNASANVPAAPAGCTSGTGGTATTNSNNDGTSSFPSSNVITQAAINGTASGTNAAANATTMTLGGVSTQVIQVCGTAALSNTTPGASTGTPASCGSTLTYGGTTQNLVIIVYDGGLDMNGCTLASDTPTTSGGGVTLIFAPVTQSAGQTCDVICVPQTSNSSGSTGTIQIAAPLSGPFSGVAIMQSQFFNADSGCGNGKSGNKAGPVDWCQAGNQPTLDLQGLIYMPKADLSFAGAISKFQNNALNCIAWIVGQFETNGTGTVLNNQSWTASITGQCTQAGVTLPQVPHTHLFYQALVG